MSATKGMTFTAKDLPARYDAELGPVLFERWARVLLDFADVRAGQRILDVASGTGIVARMAAERAGASGRVTASDISPAMVAHAKSRPPKPGAAAMEFVECPAQSLAASDASFDAVLCQQGLQFFPDKPAALAEMRRVLRPGGTVALAVWASERPLGYFGPMMRALAELVPEPFPDAYSEPRYAMSAQALAELLRGAGFGDVVVEQREVVAAFPSVEAAADGLGATPYAPAIAALPKEHQAQVRQALLRELNAEHQPATWANLARARRA